MTTIDDYKQNLANILDTIKTKIMGDGSTDSGVTTKETLDKFIRFIPAGLVTKYDSIDGDDNAENNLNEYMDKLQQLLDEDGVNVTSLPTENNYFQGDYVTSSGMDILTSISSSTTSTKRYYNYYSLINMYINLCKAHKNITDDPSLAGDQFNNSTKYTNLELNNFTYELTLTNIGDFFTTKPNISVVADIIQNFKGIENKIKSLIVNYKNDFKEEYIYYNSIIKLENVLTLYSKYQNIFDKIQDTNDTDFTELRTLINPNTEYATKMSNILEQLESSFKSNAIDIFPLNPVEPTIFSDYETIKTTMFLWCDDNCRMGKNGEDIQKLRIIISIIYAIVDTQIKSKIDNNTRSCKMFKDLEVLSSKSDTGYNPRTNTVTESNGTSDNIYSSSNPELILFARRKKMDLNNTHKKMMDSYKAIIELNTRLEDLCEVVRIKISNKLKESPQLNIDLQNYTKSIKKGKQKDFLNSKQLSEEKLEYNKNILKCIIYSLTMVFMSYFMYNKIKKL